MFFLLSSRIVKIRILWISKKSNTQKKLVFIINKKPSTLKKAKGLVDLFSNQTIKFFETKNNKLMQDFCAVANYIERPLYFK